MCGKQPYNAETYTDAVFDSAAYTTRTTVGFAHLPKDPSLCIENADPNDEDVDTSKLVNCKMNFIPSSELLGDNNFPDTKLGTEVYV